VPARRTDRKEGGDASEALLHYKKLLQDSLCYHKLYRKVEQLNREHFLAINLSNFRPIDTVEIPDYLPEDI
jgi:hypothetical protein